MLGLSHVILHVALCGALARSAPGTTIAMRVQLAARVGDPSLDKTYRFKRGEEAQAVVEFDMSPGVYRLTLDVPKYGCSSSDFLDFLADRDRTVIEALSDGSAAPAEPLLLLEGTAPTSFQYVKPAFVLLDSSVACNYPVSATLPARIVIENERDAYYAWLHFEPAPDAPKPTVAFRLRTPTGLYHYIRLPIPFPSTWGGWPSNVRFNVTEDELDGLATDKVDTLLCPKLWETSVH